MIDISTWPRSLNTVRHGVVCEQGSGVVTSVSTSLINGLPKVPGASPRAPPIDAMTICEGDRPWSCTYSPQLALTPARAATTNQPTDCSLTTLAPRGARCAA